MKNLVAASIITILFNIDCNTFMMQQFPQQVQLQEALQQVEDLKCQVDGLQSNNEYLQQLLRDEENRTVMTYDEDDHCYTDGCKMVVFDLLDKGVTAGHVSEVMEAVLKLVDKKANKLPSRWTVARLNLERLSLAQKQLGIVFASKKDTTLMTDETSKFGHKYMGYEATDDEGNNYVLAVRDIETKSAENTLNVFKEILQDIDDVMKRSDDEVSKLVLQHISATMSDRAATEVGDHNNIYYSEFKFIYYLAGEVQ